ncbi:MAG TPA: nuclear transport factor 2 family protein [Candidatus Eisenbacteria bacterium]
MRFLFLLLLVLAVVPSCGGNNLDTALEAAKAKSAIDSLWTRYAVASDQHDAIGFESLFIEDGTLVYDRAPTVNGRRAIGAFLDSLYRGVDATGLRIVPEDLQVSGTLAAQCGTFEESFNEAGKPKTEYGRFVLIADRGSDQTWRIRRLVALADSTGD